MTERLAVLDLGSNAVRLILARVTPGVEFRVLRQERVQARLAGDRRGLLPRWGVEQTLRAIRRFLAADSTAVSCCWISRARIRNAARLSSTC